MDVIKIHLVEEPEVLESEARSLDEMLRAAHPRFTLSRHRWRPQIDIYETAEEIVIRAEIAGVRLEQIQIEIAPGTVKIAGIREGSTQEKAHYRLAEIPCGYFERTLSLPALIDTRTADAIYRDGLLEIHLAKRPLDRICRIHVQGS
jgi:HSP20 family protein